MAVSDGFHIGVPEIGQDGRTDCAVDKTKDLGKVEDYADFKWFRSGFKDLCQSLD